MKKYFFPLLAGLLFWGGSLSAPLAQHGGHSSHPPAVEKKPEPVPDREASPTRAFLLEEGIKASFSIMTAAEHRKMLQEMKMKVEVDPKATHNIAVTLTNTRSNQPFRTAVVKMKVIGPGGAEEVKMLGFIRGMDQYAGDFVLSEKGKHQILIHFKAGGQKRAAGFYYLLK